MIFDAVKNQRSVITVTDYTSASDKIKKGSLSILGSEPLVWTVDNPSINTAAITVQFVDLIRFEDLIFDFNSAPDAQCFYSQDGLTWNQFNYFHYDFDEEAFSGSAHDQKVVASYSQMIVKVDYITQQSRTIIDSTGSTVIIPTTVRNHYTLYNSLSGKAEAISPDDYQIVASYLDAAFSYSISNGVKNLRYVFRIVDGVSGVDKCIYDALDITHIKLQINNITGKLDLTQLQVMTSADINITDTYLTSFSGSLFKAKYFEDNPFIPDIANTFFEMLEHSDSIGNRDQSTGDITIDVGFDPDTNKVSLSITPELQLGSFYNPVFIWRVGSPTSTKRFVYTSLQDDWVDVNSYLSGKIGNIDTLVLEFTIQTSKFALTKTVTVDLSTPL